MWRKLARAVAAGAVALATALAAGAWPARAQDAAGAAADPAQALQSVYERGLEFVDTDRLESLYELVDPDVRSALEVDWERFLRTMGREGLPSPGELLGVLWGALVRELVVNAHLLGRLLALAVLGGALYQLGRGLGGDAAVEAGRAVVVLATVLVALRGFQVALEQIGNSTRQMSSIAGALLPTLAGLSGLGGPASAAAVALHPLLLGILSASGELLRRVVVPGVVLGASLGVAGFVAPEFPLGRLGRFVQHAALAVLGLSLTVLLGVVAVRGTLGPVADSVALRATRFVAGAAVPVVGRMVSEAVEVVAGGSALIRAGLGAAGLAMVVLASVTPVVKLMALLFVFRLASALLEPVGDPHVAGVLGTIGDAMGLLLAGLAVTVVVCLLAISAMVGASALPWLIP